MCMLTKDIHFLRPSKPFVRDNAEGICGREIIRLDTSCPAKSETMFSSCGNTSRNHWKLVAGQHPSVNSYPHIRSTQHCPTKNIMDQSLRVRSSILTIKHCITLATMSIMLKSKSHPSSNSIPLSSIQNCKKGSGGRNATYLFDTC